MIYNEEFETMPREALESIQLRRLQATVARVYNATPFYRRRFDEAGVAPADIRSLSDLQKLPFTTKTDLRDNYPFGMFAVPMDNVARIHASSGTTGKPTVVGYTARDIETWAELMARSLMAAGARRDDIVHNAYGYGLFTGGLGVHYGAERLGASVIPISGGNTKRQIMIMKDFGPTVLTCTPSYALHLAEVAAEMGVSFRDLKFKAGIFGAEPWSEQMRQEIETHAQPEGHGHLRAERGDGPGRFHRVHRGPGRPARLRGPLHPRNHRPAHRRGAALWEPGELVFTTITKEAFPVIRYRTRDLSVLNPEPCRCGRTIVRMGRIQGRTDDMLIIRGVNVFPSQIESVLMETKALRAALPARGGTHRHPGPADGARGGERGHVLRRDQEPAVHRTGAGEEHPRDPGGGRPGQTGGAQGHPAQRGQGRARDRQAQNLMSCKTQPACCCGGRIVHETAQRALTSLRDHQNRRGGNMHVEQISIFLENKAGRLSEVTRIFEAGRINIRALSLADTSDFGILRLIVNDNEKAKRLLKEAGFTVRSTEVVAVEVQDKPGGLHQILTGLSKAGLNVEYMYAFVRQSGQNAVLIFRFDNTAAAVEVLRREGVRVIDGQDLYAM